MADFNLHEAQLDTLQKIVASLPIATHRRAVDYMRSGHVAPINFGSGKATAQVYGTEVYQASLSLDRGTSTCTCPAEKPCKHIAAVALVLLRDAAGTPTSGVAAVPDEEYLLTVRFMQTFTVLLNAQSPTGKLIPVTRNNFRYLKPAHRDLLNHIGSYVAHVAQRGMPYRDFAYVLLEKAVKDPDVLFYFDTEEEPCRFAGLIKPQSEIHEVEDPNDELNYEKFGYRRVRFERSHTVLDPVTAEPYTFQYNMYYPSVKRAEGGAYFYVMSVPHDIATTLKPYFLENIERMKGSEIRRKWEHGFETMAASGPKLMLSVMGVENAKSQKLVLEGKLEFAYARSTSHLVGNDAGGEIADGAKPIYGIAVSQQKTLGKPVNEIVQHKTGVLVKRLGREEEVLLRFNIPFKYTSIGRVRIAKKRYADFITQEIPKAKEAGIIVRINDNILGLLVKSTVTVDLKGSSGINWFEGGIHVEGLDRGHLREVIKAYRQKEELVKLKNGNWLSVQGSGIADVLKSLERLGITTDADGTISKMSFAQLASLEAENEAQLRTEAGANTALRKIQSLLQVTNFNAKPHKSLQAKLRHYQLEGFQFLLHLHGAEVGGILADDMGLGKTVQAIAAMNYLTEAAVGAKGAKSKFLVVCPLAALGVWEGEIQKFSPNLAVYRWHGGERSLKEAAKCDVLVTTFTTFTLDAEKFAETQWDMAFVDEAQFVKNFRSKAARALRKINTRSIVCLTGTPLENYLEDLWALFDLIFPGYLGTAQSFKDAYGGHLEVRDREGLLKKIRPFMLRRRKSEVLQELPPKTETLVKIPMTREQAKVYEAARIRALSNVGKTGSPLFDLLRHLTNLRRIACHPYLEDELTDPFHSGKFEYLDSILEELSVSAEGVLIFSQYTSVLRVLKTLLKKRAIPFLYLDGKTSEKSRRTLVNEFQSGGAKFFLISLKAGGTALTLTRADTVIHLDPWWNPAVENQATDRAHRIGQNKHVMVYKLISEGSVEEKVLSLQGKKRELFNELIDGEASSGGKITREDIAALLQG